MAASVAVEGSNCKKWKLPYNLAPNHCYLWSLISSCKLMLSCWLTLVMVVMVVTVVMVANLGFARSCWFMFVACQFLELVVEVVVTCLCFFLRASASSHEL